MLEKLDSKLAGWKAKLLSRAGRLTLIQTVGQSLLVYTMQTTAIPKKICSEIDSRLRRFWWGHDSGNNRSFCLRSWSTICTTKSHGGLGVQLAKEGNLALLAEWGWEFVSGKKSLCLDILHAKYLREDSFLKKEPKASDSWIWKGILSIRDLICHNAFISVGDGKKIDIWKDPWVPCGRHLRPNPTGLPRKVFLRVSDFI